MNYEEKTARLNEIVKLLESGKLPLDKAIEYYKEGMELTKECKEILENAQLTITEMNGETEDD